MWVSKKIDINKKKISIYIYIYIFFRYIYEIYFKNLLKKSHFKFGFHITLSIYIYIIINKFGKKAQFKIIEINKLTTSLAIIVLSKSYNISGDFV